MTKKVGRPKDKDRAYFRSLFAEWSDRTFARYWAALSSLRALSDDLAPFYDNQWYIDEFGAANKAAGRPNGSLNVAEFVRACNEAFVKKVDEAIADGVLEWGDGGDLVFSQSALNERSK